MPLRTTTLTGLMTRLGDPRFRRSRDKFVAQLFFGSNPVLDVFPVVAAALKIQIILRVIATGTMGAWNHEKERPEA